MTPTHFCGVMLPSAKENMSRKADVHKYAECPHKRRTFPPFRLLSMQTHDTISPSAAVPIGLSRPSLIDARHYFEMYRRRSSHWVSTAVKVTFMGHGNYSQKQWSFGTISAKDEHVLKNCWAHNVGQVQALSGPKHTLTIKNGYLKVISWISDFSNLQNYNALIILVYPTFYS